MNGSIFKVYICVFEFECNYVMIVYVGGKVVMIEKNNNMCYYVFIFFFLVNKFFDGLKIIL